MDGIIILLFHTAPWHGMLQAILCQPDRPQAIKPSQGALKLYHAPALISHRVLEELFGYLQKRATLAKSMLSTLQSMITQR